MDVDFSKPFHLKYFRNSLIESYRLYEGNCHIFYDMGYNEDSDIVIKESFENNGFVVSYEDMGARRSIFDDFDSLEHFQCVNEFKEVLGNCEGLDDDKVSDIALTLEEIHPQLFDALSASAGAFKRAQTEEELAQATFSGRRFLERLADYLYPARDELSKDHKVGRAEYRNRLWAYIDNAISESMPDKIDLLRKHGEELDRLIKLLNSGLHHEPSHKKVMATLRDLLLWLDAIIKIDITKIRKPYLAYQKNIIDIIQNR